MHHSMRNGGLVLLTILCSFIPAQVSGQGQGGITDHDPRWSPDGSQIAFYSNRAGNFDVYVANADGTGLRRLTEDPATDGAPAWSPDGKLISFPSDREDDREIYTVSSDGSDLRQLTDEKELRFGNHRWSPDGTRIAFEGRREDNADIYTMSPDGSEIRRITTHPSNDFAPAWSPDGGALYFHSKRSGTYQVYRIGLADEGITRLTDGAEHRVMGSVSPEGDRLAILAYEGGIPQIVLIDPTGEAAPVKVTDSAVRKQRAEISPDGGSILYTIISSSQGHLVGQIHRINIDGTGNTNLSERME